METITLPKWIFEEGIGFYFLVAIKPDGSTDIDGQHSEVLDIVKAKKLFQSLKILNIPENTKYYMVKIEEVPELEVELNMDAINTLNKL